MPAGPDLIVVGQALVNDIVPAAPGPWRREIGGSALYAIAGARLWLDPARIGIVTRIGHDCPFDLERLLGDAGIGHVAIGRIPDEQLIEWLIYEEDGSRRTLPRNPALRGIGAEGSLAPQPFYEALLAISPPARDIPEFWLPADAIHLCPQVGTRHPESLAALEGRAGWISVDPSPHYSRAHDSAGLGRLLRGCSAFLPSAQEVQPILDALGPADAALAVRRAGFPEVVIKNGAGPIAAAAEERVEIVQVTPVRVVDPTGAGDSFCGAYAACRLLGHDPFQAVSRAALSAALVVGCSGAREALALTLPR